MKLLFLHGTETGTAQILADDLVAEVSAEHDAKALSLEDLTPAELAADTLHIIVTSTFGSGEMPTTAEDFYQSLKKDAPDLSHVRFALFGLGDHTFGETFAMGSEEMLKALLACGAKQVGERGIHDAATPDLPEDVALPWLKDILQKAVAPA